MRTRIVRSLWYAFQRHSLEFPPRKGLTLVEGSDGAVSNQIGAQMMADLRVVDLFKGLSDDDLRIMMPSIKVSQFGRGEVLIRQGETGDSFFVLRRGTVEVVEEGSNRMAPIVVNHIDHLSEKNFFGEIALLRGEARTTTVRATTDVEVLEIGRSGSAICSRRGPRSRRESRKSRRPARRRRSHSLRRQQTRRRRRRRSVRAGSSRRCERSSTFDQNCARIFLLPGAPKPRYGMANQMRKRITPITTGILFFLLAGTLVAAETSGLSEYQNNCARCHGSDAKGNGPDTREKPGYRAADLTQISKRHGGRFPRQEIYDIIDGGKRLPGHYNFNSPMPLWGLSFQLEGKEYTDESEAAVKRKIGSLLDYLESIQEK